MCIGLLVSACVCGAHGVRVSDSEKTAEQQAEEERILQQRMEVVDMRDSLVAFLDEKRQVVSGCFGELQDGRMG